MSISGQDGKPNTVSVSRVDPGPAFSKRPDQVVELEIKGVTLTAVTTHCKT